MKNNSTFEGEVNPERFGRYEEWEKYDRGGHSIIYLANDSLTGNKVAIKRHLDFMPKRATDPQEIRNAQQRYQSEISVLERIRHPGIVESYGYFFRTEHGIPIPHLVMELLDTDTIEDRLLKGDVGSEQQAREVVMSVGTILDYLHTANGIPIIYRDLKPGNIKEMPVDAPWPHKVVDLSDSKLGDATMSGSVFGTPGYNSPETYGGGIANRTSDFYSLLRVASRMLISDDSKFRNTHLDNPSTLRELHQSGDFNASGQFLKVAEKATARDPSHRYKTLVEIARDLGYKISRAPQTREELEAVLGHRSLPARVETRTKEVEVPRTETQVAETQSSNLPAVVDDGTITAYGYTSKRSNLPIYSRVIDNGDGTLTIVGSRKVKENGERKETSFKIKKGIDFYETLQN